MNLFFVFEGIDGSGKTTLSKLIAEKLKSTNRLVIWHREPTSGDHGKRIRQFLSGKINLTPEEQLELFILDRSDSVSEVIKPNLEKGNIVIQDRYIYSTAAYQGISESECKAIMDLNIEKGFPLPKQVFFLDITPEEARERRKHRGGLNEAFDEDSIQNKIYQNYLKILPGNTIFLDGTQSLDALVDAVMECIDLGK